jgi:hypothetical protein
MIILVAPHTLVPGAGLDRSPGPELVFFFLGEVLEIPVSGIYIKSVSDDNARMDI